MTILEASCWELVFLIRYCECLKYLEEISENFWTEVKVQSSSSILDSLESTKMEIRGSVFYRSIWTWDDEYLDLVFIGIELLNSVQVFQSKAFYENIALLTHEKLSLLKSNLRILGGRGKQLYSYVDLFTLAIFP